MAKSAADDADYLSGYTFLDMIWRKEGDEDLAALLSSMQVAEDGRPFDPAFIDDWNLCRACVRQSPDAGYETLILFLEEKSATWSGESNYLPDLVARMRSAEREDMHALWETAKARD
ncbi:MAG: hypothetical protein ACYDB1_07510 [Acidiferrobacteraceae bacterium]